MPIMTHCFETFPDHIEQDLIAIYTDEVFFRESRQECPLTQLKQKMLRPGAKLYATHFGGRWLASAIVTGSTDARQVHHLCVHTSVRLRGIGKKLLKEIRRMESLAGNRKLITYVSSQNHAGQSFLNAITAYQTRKVVSSTIENVVPFKQLDPKTSLCFSIMS